MDCKETCSLIHLYMDNQLEAEQLEPFIKHIHGCKRCAEELEMHYIILEGTRRLEGGEQIGVDYQKELFGRLRRQLNRIHLHRRIRIQAVVFSLAVSFFGIILGYFEQEDHTRKVMEAQVIERGDQYFYHQTKEYLFRAYTPPSLKEIIYYGE